MRNRRSFLLIVSLAPLLAWQSSASAQGSTNPGPQNPESANRLYAIEFKVGPRWDSGKPPQEQAFFRDHSANLRALREQGTLVLGARYGDKGLVVLFAESEAAARGMIEQDPSIKHGTFVYELHELSVFYGGTLQPAPRKK